MSVCDDIVDFIPAMRAYAWVLTRRHEEADDLVQDTLTKAIAKVDSYRLGTNLRAWLFTIMRNTFLNDIVKAKRLQTGTKDCVSTIVTSPPTQEWSVRGRELMQAVDRLPRHYREMLVLVLINGESYETAAQIVGVRIGTVKSRLNRARAMVAEQLEARAPNAPLEALNATDGPRATL